MDGKHKINKKYFVNTEVEEQFSDIRLHIFYLLRRNPHLQKYLTVQKDSLICAGFKSRLKLDLKREKNKMANHRDEDNLELVKTSIKSFPNFPKAGVNFKDIFAVLRNPKAFKALIELVKEKAR